MSCPRCGFENPDGFRFCGNCGAPLSGRSHPGLDGERKIISAFFCDVVGSTERAERLDPEDVRHQFAGYYAAARAELERFGGTVEKFIGDAVCGLFGVPKSHGDDPERAVHAALAVRDRIAELNDADPTLDLHIRVGVATGEALVALDAWSTEGEVIAWGDVLNTAARLQTAAPVDGVFVDEATYRATRDVMEYGVAEPVGAKGKAEPVLVWKAIAPRSRRGLDISQMGTQRLVGRRDELALLLAALDRVGHRRSPELVTLIGETGIGKSRLVLELFRQIELGPALVTWRQARSSPYGDGFTFWALGEIVKAQAGILETDDSATTAEKLGQAVRDLVQGTNEATRLETHLRSLVGIDAAASVHGGERQTAFATWRRFLEAVAERRTLVLVFEDIHWADAGLLDFIEHVLDWSRNVPIVIVCTARPELLEARPGWPGERTNAVTISLAPLSSDEIRDIVGELVTDALPQERIETIVGAAAGNPLFATEFVRMLVERPEQSLTPQSVQAIVAARLDGLSAENKLVLQDASVVGRVVWPGALARIEDRSQRVVERQLRELVHLEFLARVNRSSVAGEPEFQFRHVLVRDVAYEQIPRARRAQIHRATAEWLQSLSPDRTADRAEMLALHYLSAYEYVQATGGDTSALAEGARMSLRDAGDRALSLNAFAAAERHYRAALDLWPEHDSERPWILFHLGKTRYYADTEGADVLTDAERMLREAGDIESAAEAATYLAMLAHQRGEHQDRVFEHAYRAMALVEGRHASRSRAYVLLDLAGFLGLRAEHEQAIQLAEEALRDAEELGLPELEALALATMGISRGLSGDLRGREDLERGITITEAIDSALGSHLCGMLAELEHVLGNLDRCFELQARARRYAERFGHSSHIQWLKAEYVAEGWWTGHWDEALEHAEEVVGEAEAGPGHFMEGYCRVMRGRIRLARADVEGALEDSLRALDQARHLSEPQTLYPALAFRGLVLAASGALPDAVQFADELLDEWRRRLNHVPASAWVMDLACALELMGRESELVEAAAEVRNTSAWLDAAVAFSSHEFTRAADLFARIGSRPDEALARLRAAEALTASDADEDARTQLDRALAFYREVGAKAYVAEAEAVSVA